MALSQQQAEKSPLTTPTPPHPRLLPLRERKHGSFFLSGSKQQGFSMDYSLLATERGCCGGSSRSEEATCWHLFLGGGSKQ